MSHQPSQPGAELHTHLGSSVNPAILWSIAHRHGIRLPSKDYWEFEDLITMTGKERNKSLDEMHNNFFYWTELIQSSPDAIEDSVRSVLGGGYRASNIHLQELRFNPMFRNRKGEKDLDHIIMASVSALNMTKLEYPQVRAGIILMMDRTLTFKQNKIILEKAIKYHSYGIVGIDIAGPQRKVFSMKKYLPLFKKAKEAGLGVTLHSGEEGSLAELEYVVDKIEPDRIGHGIMCVKSKKIMDSIRKKNITLELCPTSNIKNSVVRSYASFVSIIKTIQKNKIRFTINTDGPEMYATNLLKEQEILIEKKIVTRADIKKATCWAFEATFIKENSSVAL